MATHPDRFGMLANIPLGDPSFEPVFAALNKWQASIHIHL